MMGEEKRGCQKQMRAPYLLSYGSERVISTFVRPQNEMLGHLKVASSSKTAPFVSHGMIKTILESGAVDRRGKNNHGRKEKWRYISV